MATDQTLLIVANEPPFPTQHGGRVDQWSRYRWLKTQGWRLYLVAWTSGSDLAPTTQDLARIHSVFDEAFFFDCEVSLKGLARRVTHLLSESPHVSSRRVTCQGRSRVIDRVAITPPSAILLDGLYGGVLALDLARTFDVPLVYRSHNLEFRYMAGQSRAAKTIRRRAALALASLNLEKFETRLHREAACIFEISHEDCQFWQERGYPNHVWLPPVLDPGEVTSKPRIAWNERGYDVAYMGNLNTPNNVRGLFWFIDEVLPRLDLAGRNLKILLAGSNPDAGLIERAKTAHNITIQANPEAAEDIRRQARVLINPVLSGSGLNMKNVEALYTDSPIVTTSVGVAGFAEDQKRAFVICDDPQDFAGNILECLKSGPVADTAREEARDLFSVKTGAWLLEALERAIEGDNQSLTLPADRAGSIAPS